MVDGLFDVLADDAVAAEEVAALFAHLITEDARLHGKGNLAGTRGLGAVADDASGHAQGVLEGVLDDAERLTQKVGDATAGGATRTDGTTVGREPADARLLVDGNEVRQGHGTNRAFLVDVVFFGVGEDGQAEASLPAAAHARALILTSVPKLNMVLPMLAPQLFLRPSCEMALLHSICGLMIGLRSSMSTVLAKS